MKKSRVPIGEDHSGLIALIGGIVCTTHYGNQVLIILDNSNLCMSMHQLQPGGNIADDI